MWSPVEDSGLGGLWLSTLRPHIGAQTQHCSQALEGAANHYDSNAHTLPGPVTCKWDIHYGALCAAGRITCLTSLLSRCSTAPVRMGGAQRQLGKDLWAFRELTLSA